MISSVSSTLSALHAFEKKMGVAADNIANVNTDEFKKNRANLNEGPNGDVQVDIQQVDSPGHTYQSIEGDEVVEKETSNVDLSEEFPEMMTSQHGYNANLKALQAQDEMLGNFLDIIT